MVWNGYQLSHAGRTNPADTRQLANGKYILEELGVMGREMETKGSRGMLVSTKEMLLLDAQNLK